jgi:hypothetical protein
MDRPYRQPRRKAVADDDGGDVGGEHARHGPGNDQQGRAVMHHQRHRGHLGFVAHLGEEKSDKSGDEHTMTSRQAGFAVLVELIWNQGPRRHGKKRQSQGPAQDIGRNRGDHQSSQRAGETMVGQRRNGDPQDDGKAFLETGGQDEGKKLGFIADLGQRHDRGGNEKRIHANLLSVRRIVGE